MSQPLQFQQGLFGCFDNMGVCVLAFFLPCYTRAKVSEAVGENFGLCCFTYTCLEGGISLAAATATRGKLRQLRGIDGSISNDLLYSLCCGPCTACQEYAEFKYMTEGSAIIRQ